LLCALCAFAVDAGPRVAHSSGGGQRGGRNREVPACPAPGPGVDCPPSPAGNRGKGRNQSLGDPLMRLRQVCWVFWVSGTALIVLSWVNLVTPRVGWIGFAVAMVGALVSYIPQPEDRSAYPLTQEGLPVEPSGAPVPPDMPLGPGTPLLAFSRGKW